MSISISNIVGSSASATGTVGATQSAQALTQAGGSKAPDGDGDLGVEPAGQGVSTSVSALASAVSRHAGGAKSLSSFRPGVVSQLQNQISAGSYQPNMVQTAAAVSRALKGMGG
jgi:hypothetical protein